ncbi:hypothetical protein ERX46_08090 [Brumimicrobium glaciale]|uniref:Uncharacterized protein n=1 Tax=Brumimicrobium glaciale TaxID=200475 RepID=A0A4Q4KKY7_9FLAO|nr:DUF6625 family protein [Brumimicrobium glaciale]RYM33915.1 hypothetical protein ERX46_08090 [Brumimicrobium glaciale]
MLKITFIIPYFGKWPEWMELFIDSIERNKTIDFHFITDCDTTVSKAPNIFFHKSTFEEYVNNAQQKLDVPINIPNPYKICDLRPFFGIIHADIIKGYDFFGWTDVDLLFGDIRSFYTEEVLSNHDVISSHAIRLAGHCALLRNKEEFRNMGYKVYNWAAVVNNPNFVGIDEHGMTNALTMTVWDKLSEKLKMPWIASLFSWKRIQKMKRYYFVEQYSTPFTPIPWLDGTINSDQPEEWYYKNGSVTNNRDDREFMYIHFMNFKSSQWRHDGTKAPWEEKDVFYAVDNIKNKIFINTKGIYNG